MGFSAIPAILAMVFMAGVAKAFGVGWFWVILGFCAAMIVWAFIMDWWNVRSGSSGWFDRLVTRVFGPAQIVKDQTKEDEFILKKGHHS